MNFSLPYQSPNIRYGFKVYIDQFGNRVPSHFHDELEIVAIKEFEKYMLQMVKANPNNTHTMIELGSNQAYYSLMFHSILKKLGSNPVNILVETNKDHLVRGVDHFSMNGFDVQTKCCSIGNLEKVVEALQIQWPLTTAEGMTHFNPNWLTLTDIFKEFNIDHLDVLHCDLDFSELVLFETAEEIFREKKIKYIFLSTHGPLHEPALEFLKNCGYEILLNHDKTLPPVGFDTLIIARA